MLRMLRSHGARLDVFNKWGVTPAGRACALGGCSLPLDMASMCPLTECVMCRQSREPAVFDRVWSESRLGTAESEDTHPWRRHAWYHMCPSITSSCIHTLTLPQFPDRVKCVQVLVESGCALNPKDADNQTPAMIAAREGETQLELDRGLLICEPLCV